MSFDKSQTQRKTIITKVIDDNFAHACGLKYIYMVSYGTGGYMAEYEIVDERKFMIANIKYIHLLSYTWSS